MDFVNQIRLGKLNLLIERAWEHNSFYRAKWSNSGLSAGPVQSLAELARYPFTTRLELAEDQQRHPPCGTNLSCGIQNIKRVHRSWSGTRAPLVLMDTEENWRWMGHCSATLFRLAGVTADHSLLIAVPVGFGPGPWMLVEGARLLNCRFTCTGHEPIKEQLQWAQRFRPRVLVTRVDQLSVLRTAAQESNIPLPLFGFEKIIVCGQGAFAGAAREKIRREWQAPCQLRYGCSEAGPVAAECARGTGKLHLLETEYVAEIVHFKTEAPCEAGERGELVLTSLGRLDSPVIRYRTGEVARIEQGQCACGHRGLLLNLDPGE